MEPPYHGMTPIRAMLKIQKSEPPRLDTPFLWSNEFNDFIAKCLVRDPRQRPTATELLRHPFIETVSKNNDSIIDLLLEYSKILY